MSDIAIKNQDASLVNKHGDHVASCLCCAKLRGSLGDWGREDDGALDSPYIDCSEDEFSFGEDDGFPIAILHNTARHCRLFVPNDEAG